jgi:hypothetical protein
MKREKNKVGEVRNLSEFLKEERSGQSAHRWHQINDNGAGSIVHRGWGKIEITTARGFSGEEVLLVRSRTVAHSHLRVWLRSGHGEPG